MIDPSKLADAQAACDAMSVDIDLAEVEETRLRMQAAAMLAGETIAKLQADLEAAARERYESEAHLAAQIAQLRADKAEIRLQLQAENDRLAHLVAIRTAECDAVIRGCIAEHTRDGVTTYVAQYAGRFLTAKTEDEAIAAVRRAARLPDDAPPPPPADHWSNADLQDDGAGPIADPQF